MNADRITALRCAVAVLDGSAGGYTETAKYQAKIELMKMLAEEEKK
jgi:hypothetical protein